VGTAAGMFGRGLRDYPTGDTCVQWHSGGMHYAGYINYPYQYRNYLNPASAQYIGTTTPPDAPDPRDYVDYWDCTNGLKRNWTDAEYTETYSEWTAALASKTAGDGRTQMAIHDERGTEASWLGQEKAQNLRGNYQEGWRVEINDICTPALRRCLEEEYETTGTVDACRCYQYTNGQNQNPSDGMCGYGSKTEEEREAAAPNYGRHFIKPEYMGRSFAMCAACTPPMKTLEDIPAEEKGTSSCNAESERFLVVQGGVTSGSTVTFAGQAITWARNSNTLPFFTAVVEAVIQVTRRVIRVVPQRLGRLENPFWRLLRRVLRTFEPIARELKQA